MKKIRFQKMKGEKNEETFLVLSVVAMASFLLVGCFPTTNTPPVITSTPVTAGTIGTAYTYTVTATDADAGDTLTYLVTGPTGMAISSAGLISGWTPAAAGTFAVTVTVSDGTDSVTQSFTITVPPIGPAEITIEVAGEYPDTATGKTYVKGGSREITVTFPAAVDNPVFKVGTVEVAPFPSLDGKVWKGVHVFTGDCDAVTITVSGVCEDLCAAKSVVVDSGNPYAKLKAKVIECDCEEGYKLKVYSDWSEETDCEDLLGCCADDCSGLLSWNVKIYDENPWEECCDLDPCIDPIAEEDGTACPVTITTECIDEEYTEDGWIDYFDGDYWVIATLTDNVGNVMKYYGWVGNKGMGAELGGELENFVELYIDPTSEDCWCVAEDPDLADDIIGDCDGTPTTACYVEPLEPCPTVTLSTDPDDPIVGQLVTITIDYTDAEKPDGAVSAYVGPSIKTLPLGIPEDAQELVLTQDGDVYTALYTFGQAGTDYIYVVDGCADCTPCKTGVTVLPVVCPEILIADEVLFEDHWWVSEGDHEITIKYDVPTDGVRLFMSSYWFDWWSGGWVIPPDVYEIELSTSDNMTFTGTQNDFWCGMWDCNKLWLYVLSGESCCPVVCTRTVMVDCEAPFVDLIVEAENTNCGTECDPVDGYIVTITSDGVTFADPCDPLCCYDSCTEVADWTVTVYDTQPFNKDTCECVGDPCAVPIEVCPGSGCDVTCELDCIPDTAWPGGKDYYVFLEVEDILGNTRTGWGILHFGSLGSVTLNDANLDLVDCLLKKSGSDNIMGPCSY